MIKIENSNYLLTVDEQEWDSSILGFKCGYFNINEKGKSEVIDRNLESLIKEALNKAKAGKYRFLTAKINAANNVIANSCFENNGALVDTELTFQKSRGDVTLNNADVPKNILVQKHKK